MVDLNKTEMFSLRIRITFKKDMFSLAMPLNV